ncbi:Type IV leader peptidase family protein [Pseudobutyrivibrio sp. JW11]|nr:Type IV leader peptidase family protein [Pseudobutyrivibrio sp. JW11]
MRRQEVKKTSTFLIWSILTSASLFDARSYRIPNQLIILGYLAGIYVNLLSYGWIGIAYFLMKAMWPIACLSLLYILGKQLGAGDIKLFSVMATLVGVNITVNTMITSVILAGIAIVVVSIYEGQLIRRKLHYSFYITAAFFLLQYK